MTDVIQTVGAYAGLVALLAMGVLAFLVFSQARDIRRLRDWAGGAPERDAEVREVSEIVAEERSAELKVLADREERRMERAGLVETSYWDRLGRSGRIIAIVAVVLILGAAAAWAATSLLGSDDNSGTGKRAAQSKNVKPAQITVGVLNGTGGTEQGLAAQYAEVLNKDGFKTGVVTDATDTFTESVVMFKNGQQTEARKVGKAVGIDNFEPVQQDVADLSSGADVTVVIGTDHGPLPGE
ncbi:MAG: LytR C-terminal domain-containing protein [Solirubrobacterales bacterium]|nr:LytR C-terminal domain-containing protein [Solirubrobacterales bacterium]MCB0860202.1 LytR C-terminal domain-containing protein [Solirubrobacterales bacterium]HRV59531.1 LytR C-terminal domain-containing protein [Solirubrobacterales bacterium]